MAIEGLVARILNDESVVINCGSAHGVKEGMRFAIFTELDEVKDPETGSSLGKLELVKARVVASHVQESMTICEAEPPAGPVSFEDPTQHTLSAEMIAVSLHSRGARGKLKVERAEVAGLPEAGPITVADRVRSVEA
ncbi:MAG: hypothetical protein ACYTKD_29905 [Planctomycetota bacterium]|jgi:hypothetical protein